jgi:hypothetical protein
MDAERQTRTKREGSVYMKYPKPCNKNIGKNLVQTENKMCSGNHICCYYCRHIKKCIKFWKQYKLDGSLDLIERAKRFLTHCKIYSDKETYCSSVLDAIESMKGRIETEKVQFT